MSSRTEETSVIVLGGSIVGLSCALFLAGNNVPFVLIERHTGSSPHPRAIGYRMRTIETFRTYGIDKEIPDPPTGMGGKPRRVKAKTLNGEWTDETHWTKPGGAPQRKPPGGPRNGPPSTNPGDELSPVKDSAIAQDKLEPLIRNKVLSMGGDLRLGCKMTFWSQSSDHVTMTGMNRSTDESFTIRAKYLIACDGASSQIRQDLGIQTHGVGKLRSVHSTLFRCPSIEPYISRGVHQWSIENSDFQAFMTRFPDGRCALMSQAPEQDSLDEAAQKARICKAVGEELNDVELLAQGRWDLQAAIADSFSSGRVFLAGDAAHALPPNRGGYGANTGIADAHNIAWKLAAVLSGESDPSLLDTYNEERRPIALVRHDQIFARDDYKDYVSGSEWQRNHKDIPILDDTAMELGQIYRSSIIPGSEDSALPDANTPPRWKGQPGTRAPHIRVVRKGEENSILDLFCKGWVLLSKDEGWRSVIDTPLKVQCQFVQVGKDIKEVSEGSFTEAYGVEETGAVLVRPDGFVAARWQKPISSEEFADALRVVARAL